jgi:hypothetical protein
MSLLLLDDEPDPMTSPYDIIETANGPIRLRPLYTAAQNDVRVPQPALPLRQTGTTLGEVEQGSPDEFVQRVAVLCSTPPEWVDGAPGFGLYDQAFLAGGADLAEVERQITTYVPDAVTLLHEHPELLDQALDILGVQTGAR